MTHSVQRIHFEKHTDYKCKFKDSTYEATVPYPEVNEEAEGRVMALFKHKIALKMADDMKFEISTIEHNIEETTKA